MGQRNNVIRIALIIVMTALTTVGTLLIRIPNPIGGTLTLVMLWFL